MHSAFGERLDVIHRCARFTTEPAAVAPVIELRSQLSDADGPNRKVPLQGAPSASFLRPLFWADVSAPPLTSSPLSSGRVLVIRRASPCLPLLGVLLVAVPDASTDRYGVCGTITTLLIQLSLSLCRFQPNPPATLALPAPGLTTAALVFRFAEGLHRQDPNTPGAGLRCLLTGRTPRPAHAWVTVSPPSCVVLAAPPSCRNQRVAVANDAGRSTSNPFRHCSHYPREV